jgi:YVTN family beta-propeller protein
MSSILFGATISMIDAATPSGWLLAYDVDGVLRQKDSAGVISNVGFGGSTQSLYETLLIGNNTQTQNIIMGTSTYLLSSNGGGKIELDFIGNTNSVLISTDNSAQLDSGLLLQNSYTALFSNGYSKAIDFNGDGDNIAIYNLNTDGVISIGVHTNLDYNQIDELKIVNNTSTTASTGNANKSSVFVGTKYSFIYPGVVNTVVVGGKNVVATQSDSVYVPDLYLSATSSIKSTTNDSLITFDNGNGDLIIDKIGGNMNSTWFRMSTSEPGYQYWSEIVSVANEATGLTGGVLIQVRDDSTSNNYSSIGLNRDYLLFRADSSTYSVSFQLDPVSNQVILTASSNFAGIQYNIDFSSNFTARSLVDKDYVDNQISLVGAPNLSQVMNIGNDTGSNNLIVGTSTYIKSSNGGGRIDLDFGSLANIVLISTDDAAQNTAYILLNNSDIETLSGLLDITTTDSRITTTNGEGLKYTNDYSSGYVNRSLVDKQYVDVGTQSIWTAIGNAVSGTGSQNYFPIWNSIDTISTTSSMYLGEAVSEYSISETIGVGTTPYNSVINYINDKIYVANNFSNNVSVIDRNTNMITATISAGNKPVDLAVDPINNTVWVTNGNSNDVTLIDSNLDIVTATISVGSRPLGIKYIDGYIYVANMLSNDISIIDTSTNTISSTISSISTPRDFAVDTDLNKLWVAGVGPDYVAIIDLDTNTLSGSVSVGANPQSLVYDPDNKYVYVANFSSSNVSVFDTTNETIIATVSVGTGPINLTYDSLKSRIYVSNLNSGNLSIIENLSVVNTISTAGQPRGLEYDTQLAKIYVSNDSSNSLQVIETIPKDWGYVGINNTDPKSHLDVNGKTTTNELRVLDGAYPGYVLTSDAGGNATWQNSVRKFRSNFTFVASVAQTITHGLTTEEVIVQAYNSSGQMVIPGIVQILNPNQIDITFSVSITNIKIVIIG